jgi:F-type H+-transporting ATPase subunit gamma
MHKGSKLFVVGEYGRQYYHLRNIEIEQSFLYTAQNPTFARAREIAAVLLDRYERGEVTKIFIIYTDYKNGMTTSVYSNRLLPFHHDHFSAPDWEREIHTPFEFQPSVQTVLDSIMPSYIAGFIYSALVDSFCCEQNSRMTAMDAANRNAEKLLEEMKLEYNHLRQDAITREITEVSAGAKYHRLMPPR